MSFTRRGFIGAVLGAIGLGTALPKANPCEKVATPKNEVTLPKKQSELYISPEALVDVMVWGGCSVATLECIDGKMYDVVYLTDDGRVTIKENDSEAIGRICAVLDNNLVNVVLF